MSFRCKPGLCEFAAAYTAGPIVGTYAWLLFHAEPAMKEDAMIARADWLHPVRSAHCTGHCAAAAEQAVELA